MSNTNSPSASYEALKSSLLSYTHVFSSLPTNPHPIYSTTLHNGLTSLQLHPVLEALLHLLNLDLPAAQFLCRHMEARPAEEAMFVHDILHRIEGDYENVRAWYGDIQGSKFFNAVWGGGGEEAGKFLDRLEKWRKNGQARGEEEEWLREESRREMVKLLEFCEEKFETGRVEDARGVWVAKEKTQEQATAMITGGEGWREF